MNNFDEEAQNPTAEVETAQVESPATETNESLPEETPEAEVSSTEEAETEETPSEDDAPSNRPSKKSAEYRIKELDARAKQAEERARSLADQVAELTGGVPSYGDMPQYSPQVQPGTEVTPEQYQADVARVANSVVELRLQQQRNIDRINREAAEAISKYSQLNPESDNFNSKLSVSISKATLGFIKGNPTASVKEYVDSLMEPYLSSVTKEVESSKETLARQVSQAAQRPTAIQKTEKSPEEMSIAELEAKLGVIQS